MTDLKRRRPLTSLKLSELLRETIKECRAYDALVHKEPEKYGWNMNEWGRTYYGTCEVCMAGATLRGRGHSMRNIAYRHKFSEAVYNVMDNIDSMRIGNFDYLDVADEDRVTLENFFKDLMNDAPEDAPSDYLSWDQYEQLAAELERLGY